MTEEENYLEVEVSKPEAIEIVAREDKPKSRPTICELFDRVKHRKSPEFIEDFKLLHPECF